MKIIVIFFCVFIFLASCTLDEKKHPKDEVNLLNQSKHSNLFNDSDSALIITFLDTVKNVWIHPDSPERIPHPTTEKMKFEGFDFGDYAHFDFINEQKKNYDFGFGYNNLEEFEFLYDLSDTSDEYIGKWFMITWDSLWSSYPCCDGDYDEHFSFMPSIVKIELD